MSLLREGANWTFSQKVDDDSQELLIFLFPPFSLAPIILQLASLLILMSKNTNSDIWLASCLACPWPDVRQLMQSSRPEHSQHSQSTFSCILLIPSRLVSSLQTTEGYTRMPVARSTGRSSEAYTRALAPSSSLRFLRPAHSSLPTKP